MRSHNPLNKRTAENLILSTYAPTIKAGVITAKVIWKAKKTVSGISPERASLPTPDKNIFEVSPIHWLPSPKARL